jgi:hypothetical protein
MMFRNTNATVAWFITLVTSIPASILIIATIETLPAVAMITLLAYGALFISATITNKTQQTRIAHNRKAFVAVEALKAGVSIEYATKKFNERF